SPRQPAGAPDGRADGAGQPHAGLDGAGAVRPGPVAAGHAHGAARPQRRRLFHALAGRVPGAPSGVVDSREERRPSMNRDRPVVLLLVALLLAALGCASAPPQSFYTLSSGLRPAPGVPRPGPSVVVGRAAVPDLVD